MVQIRAAVAGHPVHHSLTPALFMFVADHLRASGEGLRIELLKNIAGHQRLQGIPPEWARTWHPYYPVSIR